MNKPKTITQLSREQLEDFCLSLFHVDNEKANIIEELELRNEALEREFKRLKQMVNFGGITMTECPNCKKEITVNFCRETENYRKKYNEALSVLANFEPPCELDGFMDKNVDYCFDNCGVDEEVFKECWNRYIQQKLDANKG